MRLFIAVHPDSAVRAGLVEMQGRLDTGTVRVKWVESDNLHLTLHFLGDLKDAQVAAVQALVRAQAAAASPFTLAVGGMGAFPSVARPQVVWAGLTAGADELRRIYDGLGSSLEALGVAVENRSYAPHFTLGRCKEPAREPAFTASLERLAQAAMGTCRIEHLSLMRSVLGRSGPVYSHLLDAPLGP